MFVGSVSGDVAQLGERLNRTQEVGGSNPLVSTKLIKGLRAIGPAETGHGTLKSHEKSRDAPGRSPAYEGRGVVRYLVTGKSIEELLSPEQVTAMTEHLIIPSLDALAKLDRDGKGTGGVVVGQREGCIVLDVASPEELDQILTSLPFWGVVEWTVQPLLSFEAAAKRSRDLLQQMKSAR